MASDEKEIENEISKLEKMVYAIDLNVLSTQRSLESIYQLKCKTEPRVSDPSYPTSPLYGAGPAVSLIG